MADSVQPLSYAIRKARSERGLTQAELAGRVGVTQSTVSFWEQGTETPTIEHVIALAIELPEVIEHFTGREGDLLRRVLRLERELFAGRCACKGCSCGGGSEPRAASAISGEYAAVPNGRQELLREQELRRVLDKEKERQPMKLAVTGKGGVGKTTIAGTLARILAQRERRVLALDADSNPNLATSLGLLPEQAALLTPVPHTFTEWREDAQGQAYVHLLKPLAQVIDEYSVAAPDGARLLLMGTVDHAGVGCRCDAHSLARGITGDLIAEADVAVLDMEAGLEHLGRGTVEHVDVLLIVVEPYYRALEAGQRARDLAAELGVPRIVVVANSLRTEGDREAVAQYCLNHNLDLVASIPYDEAVQEAERRGMAPVDYAPQGPAVVAIRALADTLVSHLS